MALTGNPIDAVTAERAGLVSRVVPVDNTLDEAIKVATQIASLSRPVGMHLPLFSPLSLRLPSSPNIHRSCDCQGVSERSLREHAGGGSQV